MHVRHFTGKSKGSIPVWLACLGLLVQAATSLAQPARLHLPEIRLTLPDVKPGVYAQIYRPAAAVPAPAVVILHGFGGIFPAYRQLAQDLAAQSYVAMVLDYFAETGRFPRDKKRRQQLWPTFERTVQQGIEYLQKQPEVDANRIGVVGFSMGGVSDLDSRDHAGHKSYGKLLWTRSHDTTLPRH